MAGSGGTGAVAVAAIAALAAGAAGGWVAGRASFEPPPPPRAYVNPLADAKKNEVLVLVSPDGGTQAYTLMDGDGETVMISAEDVAKEGASSVRRFRAARTFVGALTILDGDIEPALAASTLRDFVVEKMEPDDLRVESLDRTFRCWKVSGRYRNLEDRTYWITEELPVHGIVRMDGPRGKRYEVRSFSFGKGKE